MSAFLIFRLEEVQSGWPPVGAESLPVQKVAYGFRIQTPPFFVKDISVGDIVRCEFDDEGYASNLVFIERSRRSTVWVAPRKLPEWPLAKAELLQAGCDIENLNQFGIAAIDVPEHVSLSRLDRVLLPLTMAGGFVAYPSLRH